MDLFKGSLETKGKFCKANIILCFEQVLHKANLLISFNNHLDITILCSIVQDLMNVLHYLKKHQKKTSKSF